MRKALIIQLLTIFFLTSCKSKEERAAEKLREDLKTYFVINIQDSTATLDSFKVVKVDTITQQMLLLKQNSLLQNELQYLMSLYRTQIDYLNACINTEKASAFLENAVLNEMYAQDTKKAGEKADLIHAELEAILAVTDKIIHKAAVADSIKPIGFEAICAFQIRLLDKSVKQDTAYIILNTNKDIVNEEDFMKIPYKVNYDKIK